MLKWTLCRHFNNAFFARGGGVSVSELNRLELEFLFRLGFRLTVTVSVFESYCSYLEKEVMAIEKKMEHLERSLPAFGSASTSPEGKTPMHWKKASSGRQGEPFDPNHLQAEYDHTFSRMMTREVSPSWNSFLSLWLRC